MPPIAALDNMHRPIEEEVQQFLDDCIAKYKFNSRWDNALNIAGLLVSMGIVTAGVYQRGAVAAVLGALVSALVSAQRAFPFGPRAGFYRMLIEQAKNLRTQLEQELIDKQMTVQSLNSLRLDFAQQFPRGSVFKTGDAAISNS